MSGRRRWVLLAAISSALLLFALSASPSWAVPAANTPAADGPLYPLATGNPTVSAPSPATDGAIGHGSGVTYTYTNFDFSKFQAVYWSMIPGSVGEDFSGTAGQGWMPAGAEAMTFDAGSSDLANGVAVWSGTVNEPIQGPKPARLKVTVQSLATGNPPLALQAADPTTNGVPANVGAVVPVPQQGFKATWLFEVNTGTTMAPNWTPSLQYYDNIPMKTTTLPPGQGGPAWSEASGAFWWVDKPPTAAINGAPSGSQAAQTEQAVALTGSDTPMDSTGTIAKREWDLGTGTYAVGGSTNSVTFNTPGTYTINYRVTDDDGNQTVATRTITVTQESPPTVDFSFAPPAPTTTQSVTFTGSESSPDETITSRQWDLGSGTFAAPSGNTASTTFTSPGTYTVRYRVTDDDGVVTTASHTVTVVTPATTSGGSGGTQGAGGTQGVGGTQGAGGAAQAPTATLSFPAQKLKAVLKSGLKVTLSWTNALSWTGQILLDRPAAKRVHLASAAKAKKKKKTKKPTGPVVIGTGSGTLSVVNGQQVITLNLSGTAVRKLKKSKTLTLTIQVTVVSATGRTALASGRVTLR